MKQFLVFFGLLATTYAGVGKLTPEIEREALRLWQQHCTFPVRSENGGPIDNNQDIFCKISDEVIPVKTTIRKEINFGTLRDQVIFVRPPSYQYEHEVIIEGSGPKPGKTTVFVKPSENTHDVTVTADIKEPGPAPKPSLYFLKAAHEDTRGNPYRYAGANQGYNFRRTRRGNTEEYVPELTEAVEEVQPVELPVAEN